MDIVKQVAIEYELEEILVERGYVMNCQECMSNIMGSYRVTYGMIARP